jgi:hypothetical protein
MHSGVLYMTAWSKPQTPNEVRIITAYDPVQFEDELNKALANGFRLYGEFHYCTWLDDIGRAEKWSMAVTRHNPNPIEKILTE